MKHISYGIGRDYLPHWGLNQALREIFQNYLDYGDYKIHITYRDQLAVVKIRNNYIPDNLEFLRIGNSLKEGKNNIGKHGEGLKMAFLVMLRNNWHIYVKTNKHIFFPRFHKNDEIGEVLEIVYREHNKKGYALFETTFIVPKGEFDLFNQNIITEEDILYSSNYHGDIVDKPTGNIYSGNLFVCHLDNLSKSYNIKPDRLPLDRDRSLPQTWDINYHTSKINELYTKWSVKDTTYDDTMYISDVPIELARQFKPKSVGNTIEFTSINDEGETIVLKNDSIKEALMRHSYFDKAIHNIKKFIAKKLGLYDLLLEFQKNHVHTTDAQKDFAIILELVTK